MKPFKLDSHPKIKPGFTVPEGYFETFGAEMMQQIGLENKPTENKIIQLRPNRKSWWFAAAAVLVLALAIPAIDAVADENQSDTAALDDYFTNTRLSDDQIVELLDNEDIDKIKIDYQLEDEAIEDALHSGTIENYILD